MKEEQIINIDGSDGRPINIVAEDGATMTVNVSSTVNISSTLNYYSYPEWFDREMHQAALAAIKAAGKHEDP